MQRWEYCELVPHQAGWLFHHFSANQASGTEEKEFISDREDLHSKIAELGQEGWELVSVVYPDTRSNYLYTLCNYRVSSFGSNPSWYFKRPLP